MKIVVGHKTPICQTIRGVTGCTRLVHWYGSSLNLGATQWKSTGKRKKKNLVILEILKKLDLKGLNGKVMNMINTT